jgi:hypothetical protein
MRVWARVVPFALAFALHAAGPFRVIDSGIHQSEDGPLVAKDTTFTPGEVFFYSCRLDGYRASPEKKVSIQYEISAVDPNGVAIVEPAASKIEVELAQEDKDWKPKLRLTVFIPPLADSGVYKIRVSAKDTLSGEAVSAEIPFEVHGRAVEPSDTLTIRNFHFHRAEDDLNTLAPAVYHPGDTVWARFDITGYKFGPGNQREVAYTVKVTSDNGRVLLAPGEPSVDQGASFYPARYSPCVISMNLQPNIRPGEYTILIDVRDRIGGQTAGSSQTFRIE